MHFLHFFGGGGKSVFFFFFFFFGGGGGGWKESIKILKLLTYAFGVNFQFHFNY